MTDEEMMDRVKLKPANNQLKILNDLYVDYMTIREYMDKKSYAAISTATCGSLGMALTKYCRKNKIIIKNKQSDTYGKINMYPAEVIALAFVPDRNSKDIIILISLESIENNVIKIRSSK